MYFPFKFSNFAGEKYFWCQHTYELLRIALHIGTLENKSYKIIELRRQHHLINNYLGGGIGCCRITY